MTKYVKEKYIRKYADKEIVDALDKSIQDHLEYSIACHKAFMGEDPTEEELEHLEQAAHNSAMGWLDRNYYTQYVFDEDDHDYEHKMQMRENYNKLVNSMTKEEIEKEDAMIKKEWDEFYKALDIDPNNLKWLSACSTPNTRMI